MKKVYQMISDLTSGPSKIESEGPYKNIHILFGDSATGSFKKMIKDGNVHQYDKNISFREMFSIGPISHLDKEMGVESRFAWICRGWML